MTKHPSPNDDRSNVKNPNNPQYEKDRQHRIEVGHPNVPPAAPHAPRNPGGAPSKPAAGSGPKAER